MNRIIAGLIITLLPCAALAQEASTDTEQVPIEEYVPKVIIEGKWGTGPGEFGRQSDFNYDLKPTSLAVDSKGNIYILDYVNNRIQKYSGEGKHLLDISIDGLRGPVQCWAVKRYDENEPGGYIWSVGSTAEKPAGVPDSDLQAYIWPPEVQGINIVIDSKDNLFYYLKRNKDGKESGEVWQFRNDKLVKKTVVPVTNMLSYGVGLDLDREDDSLWIPDVDKKQRGKHYQFRTGKILDTDEVRKQKAAFKATEAGKKAAARPRPKYYLDIEASSNGIRVIEKLN